MGARADKRRATKRPITIKRRLLVGILLPALIVSGALCLAGAPAYPQPDGEEPTGWSRFSRGGFGNRFNIACLGTAVKDGDLYFGTWATVTGACIYRFDGSEFTELITGGFGSILNYAAGTMVHDDTIYAGTFNPLSGCEVWRYDGGTKWTRVDGGETPGNGGFGDARNYGTFGAASLGGSAYIGTINPFTGCEVWRYEGGTDWTRVDPGASPGNGGFGDRNNEAAHLMVYDGSLYAAAQNRRTGVEIWRYDGGTDWTRVDPGTSPGNGGFGDRNNWRSSLGVYNGELYAGTSNEETGGEVWRYDGGTDWTAVVGGTSIMPPGFGNPGNTGVHVSTEYNDRLYVGVVNEEGGEIWRYDGTIWTKEVGDGFGNPDNIALGWITIWRGDLIATTFNMVTGTEVWVNRPFLFRAEGAPVWYLAEGATEGGFETWVLVQNPGDEDVRVRFTLNTGQGAVSPPELQNVRIEAGSRRTFNIGNYVTTYDVSTKVEALDGDIICERAMYWTPPGSDTRVLGHDSIGVTTPAPNWYLAEGATEGGFETWVLVQNPGDEDVVVRFTLNTGEGEVKPPELQNVVVGAGRRRTFNIGNYVTTFDVSTRVEALDGDIICERAMYWTPPGSDTRVLGHDSIGVTAPADTWYLAEGATEGGFEAWVLVQNPGDEDVRVDFTLNTGDGARTPLLLQNVRIEAGSRRTFNIGNYVTTFDVSIKVEARDGRIICERAMYWTPPGSDTRALGHDSVGVTAPADTWYLAEGATEGGFETWVLVQNPGTEDVVVDFTLNTREGLVVPSDLQNVVVGAGRRRTFNIGEYVETFDVSTKVEAHDGGEIICERAMYWTPPGSAFRVLGHDSVGFAPPFRL